MSLPPQGRPPLRARLCWYDLDVIQHAVLLAMVEHESAGQRVFASIARIAAYAKVSERHVYRVIGQLRSRGVLIQVKPATSRMPATYYIDETKMEIDPRMRIYIDETHGWWLRGAPQPAQGCPTVSPGMAASQARDVRESGNSKAFDSRKSNSNTWDSRMATSPTKESSLQEILRPLAMSKNLEMQILDKYKKA